MLRVIGGMFIVVGMVLRCDWPIPVSSEPKTALELLSYPQGPRPWVLWVLDVCIILVVLHEVHNIWNLLAIPSSFHSQHFQVTKDLYLEIRTEIVLHNEYIADWIYNKPLLSVCYIPHLLPLKFCTEQCVQNVYLLQWTQYLTPSLNISMSISLDPNDWNNK